MKAHTVGSASMEVVMAVSTLGLSLLITLPMNGVTMLARRDGTAESGLTARARKCADRILGGAVQTDAPVSTIDEKRSMLSGVLVGAWQSATRPFSYSLIGAAMALDAARVATGTVRQQPFMRMTRSVRKALWRADMISPSVPSMQALSGPSRKLQS
jgi:hypothetical protein